MQIVKRHSCKRKQKRIRTLLPVRVRGIDGSGCWFEAQAHTIDLTSTGARLGSALQKLRECETVVVLFGRRRVQFTVMWTKQSQNGEVQIGLQLVARETDPYSVVESLSQSRGLLVLGEVA